MPEHTLILNTLRSQKILSNKLYWEFIDNMKPYFWNTIVYKYLNNKERLILLIKMLFPQSFFHRKLK